MLSDQTTQSAPASPIVDKRLRVLAVDDSNEVRVVITELLETVGFEVCSFANPVKALEQFRYEKDKFDLVLLDYFMPQLDGAETCKWLKKICPQIKVIIVSGAEEPRLRKILAECPFDGCIRKPFNLRQALQTIQQVMSGEKRTGYIAGF